MDQAYIDKFIQFLWEAGPKVALAAVLLVGGLWIIRKMSATFGSLLKMRNVDDSLQPFFVSLVDVALKVVLLLVVASTIGLETTSFIAIFSAVAFSIGFALQGSLGNFASGVLILLFRPFRVGDHILIDEKMGVVSEILIFNTILTTPQGKKIIIPNGKITEGAIEKILEQGEVRADVIIQVKDYTPIPVLRQAAHEAVMRCPKRLPDRPPFVEISGFPHDAMQVEIGCWTLGEHYWETFYYLHESMKTAMDQHGIELAQEDRDD